MNTSNYKVVIVGDAKSGKTTFVTRMLVGEYEKQYNATVGAQVRPYTIYTLASGSSTAVPMNFQLWDCGGDEENAGLDEGYYVGAHAMIVFVDSALSASERAANMKKWVSAVQLIAGKIPVFVAVSKWDSKNEGAFTSKRHATWRQSSSVGMSAISSYSCFGVERPFFQLARSLSGDSGLVITESPACAPPMATIPVVERVFQRPTLSAY